MCVNRPNSYKELCIRNPEVGRVFKNMCRVIRVDPDTVDLSNPVWYWTHSWTKKQRDMFVRWFEKRLTKSSRARNALMALPFLARNHRHIMETVHYFTEMYGWKDDDGEN